MSSTVKIDFSIKVGLITALALGSAYSDLRLVVLERVCLVSILQVNYR